MEVTGKAAECIRKFSQAEKELVSLRRVQAVLNEEREESFYARDLTRFLVVGRFKAGKSSLINCLLGAQLAAVDSLEKTAWVARYWPAEKEFCTLTLKDGSTKEMLPEEFVRKTENDEFSEEELGLIHRVDVGYAGAKKRWCIIDTPGTGSVHTENENRALEALKDADLVIYVLDINKIGNLRDHSLIRELQESGVPMICVATKYDGDIAHHKTPEQAVEMVEKYVPFTARDVFLFSSKLFRKAPEKNGEFMKALSERLEQVSINNEQYRQKAETAGRKRLLEDELSLLYDMQKSLLEFQLSRVQFEKTYQHNRKLVETELTVFIRKYISDTLYAEYRPLLIAQLNEKRPGSNKEYSDIINSVVPTGYMDQYWNTMTKQISRKFGELWKKRVEQVSAELQEIRKDLSMEGIQLKLPIDKLLETTHGEEITEREIGISSDSISAMTAIGTFLGITFGMNPLLAIAVPLIFGMILEKSQNSRTVQGQTVNDARTTLEISISQFADQVIRVTMERLEKNELLIMQQMSLRIEKDFSGFLPKGKDLGDCLVELNDMVSALEAEQKTMGGSPDEGLSEKKQRNEELLKEISRKSARNSGSKTEEAVNTVFNGEPGGALEKLDGMIGLKSVKQDVRSMINLIRINEERRLNGIKQSPISLHMVFTGNPGTGKTTVARLIGEIYRDMGILSKGQFIEADREKLVGEYVGHTAVKTRELAESAMGGVLFIDEAYSLNVGAGGGNDFGKEAVDTLLKIMEDHRDDLVVIVAGYTNEMESFISMNPGLKSRFNKYIHFPDYEPGELTEIFEKLCASEGYLPTEECIDHTQKYFEELYKNRSNDFANGREVRNYFEQAVLRQADRLSRTDEHGASALMELRLEDVQ